MCLALAVLWPPDENVVKAVVRRSGRSRVAGPTFLAEYVFRRVPFSPFGLFFFECTSDATIFTETLQTLRMS